MYEYSRFIQQIKEYLCAGWARDEAITQAVMDCREEGILEEFLKNHGSEVVNMLYTQWNYDDAVAVEREEAFEDGRTVGLAEGKVAEKRQVIYNFLRCLGEIPEDICGRIENEQKEEVLQKWYMAAATAENFEKFRDYINETGKQQSK